MKSIELDDTSRATVGRFVLKCWISCVVALLARSNVAESIARCLLLYAILMVVVAAFTRQRYSASTFNHWSEALWLACAASGLHLLQ